nr:MAG TPA: hypothetical protein [Caudoviricetes sp.]
MLDFFVFSYSEHRKLYKKYIIRYLKTIKRYKIDIKSYMFYN